MARLEIRVNDRTYWQADSPDIPLPDASELIPAAMRQAPGEPPTPLARLTALTALVDSFRRLMESSVFQPISIDIQTAGMGRMVIGIEMGGFGAQ